MRGSRSEMIVRSHLRNETDELLASLRMLKRGQSL